MSGISYQEPSGTLCLRGPSGPSGPSGPQGAASTVSGPSGPSGPAGLSAPWPDPPTEAGAYNLSADAEGDLSWVAAG